MKVVQLALFTFVHITVVNRNHRDCKTLLTSRALFVESSMNWSFVCVLDCVLALKLSVYYRTPKCKTLFLKI